jgi:hypothetical protein
MSVSGADLAALTRINIPQPYRLVVRGTGESFAVNAKGN